MQHGCIERLNRKRGPQVWQFRWSEISLDGKRLHHKKVVGTVEQYPYENAARRAVGGLVSEINTGARPMNSDPMTVAQLCDHFAQRELAKDNSWRSHATKKIYQAYFVWKFSFSIALKIRVQLDPDFDDFEFDGNACEE
jgi:hypothetical protein